MATQLDPKSRPFEEINPPMDSSVAVLEADRCLECGGVHAAAPCSLACPANIDVPSFVSAIADGDLERAAKVIFDENLLGGTCARVCPTELLCEGACVLVHEGRKPIEIGRLQRHATEAAFEAGSTLRRRRPQTGFRVAVIGAGPAGLACAGELAANGHEVTVYDERREPGGLVRYAIAPYRQQNHPLPEEAALIRQLGAHVVLGSPIDRAKFLAIRGMNDAVVLAVGMGADTSPHLPGDDLSGVWSSLPFIEALKTGTPPPIGRKVAVIGGGNTAIDCAREAVRLGADHVVLLYRRTEAEMPAYPQEVREAREEGVEIRRLTAPTRFLGRERLTGVECVRMELGAPDADGRARPQPVLDSEHVVLAETAIVAIGQQPRPEFADLLAGFDPETGRTKLPGLYAAGDATNGGATVVEAVREGKLAASTVDLDLRAAS
jgi:glutamate synthase (NADPH/NADH) small chain